MATLKKKRSLTPVPRETPESTRNSQSQNTLNPRMAEECMTQVSEEIEKTVNQNLSQEISRTESCILGDWSEFDEFLLNPKVRTCSVAVPGAYRSNNSENREPTGVRSVNDHCPEMVFCSYLTSETNGSDQEETQEEC